METPLVTVICLCYNHGRFVTEAVASVMGQTYKHIELIVVDDASKDNSREKINDLCKKHASIRCIENEINLGMCASFNKALALSKGAFIINLAADDVLLAEVVEKQVAAFSRLDDSWGVVFSDAYVLDEKGEITGTFYKRNAAMELQEEVISGDIFKKVVAKYQICSPTLMVRRKVLTELGGYDESLSYEDYDFYIRSSRKYHYFFIDEALIGRREVKGSNSDSWYRRKDNPHLRSTLKVLKKYLQLCEDKEEMEASLPSIRYHMRQSLFMECFSLTKEYFMLINNLKKVRVGDRIIYALASLKIPLYGLFGLYRFFAHRKKQVRSKNFGG